MKEGKKKTALCGDRDGQTKKIIHQYNSIPLIESQEKKERKTCAILKAESY